MGEFEGFLLVDVYGDYRPPGVAKFDPGGMTGTIYVEDH